MADKRCILGITGMGKSTLARQLVADVPRLLVHDPQEDHDALRLDYVGFADYLECRYTAAQFRVGLYEGGHGAQFCAWAWTIGKRLTPPGLTVVIDEADMVAMPNREPQGFHELMARGRHHDIAVIGIARRPTEVSRNLTANAAVLYVFRTQEPKDIAYLAGIMGSDAAHTVAELQPFEYVEWTPAGHERKQLAVHRA